MLFKYRLLLLIIYKNHRLGIIVCFDDADKLCCDKFLTVTIYNVRFLDWVDLIHIFILTFKLDDLRFDYTMIDEFFKDR